MRDLARMGRHLEKITSQLPQCQQTGFWPAEPELVVVSTDRGSSTQGQRPILGSGDKPTSSTGAGCLTQKPPFNGLQSGQLSSSHLSQAWSTALGQGSWDMLRWKHQESSWVEVTRFSHSQHIFSSY